MFAKFFTASLVSASFDNAIEAAAKTGRVSSILTDAIATQYGMTFKGSPKAIADDLARNYLATVEATGKPAGKATGKATGKAAKPAYGAVKVSSAPAIHAIHAALVIVHAAGVKFDLPNLSGTWADPIALQAASDARKVKAKETREAKRADAQDDAQDDAPAAPVAPVANPSASLADSVSTVLAAILAGDILPGGAAWADLVNAMESVSEAATA